MPVEDLSCSSKFLLDILQFQAHLVNLVLQLGNVLAGGRRRRRIAYEHLQRLLHGLASRKAMLGGASRRHPRKPLANPREAAGSDRKPLASRELGEATDDDDYMSGQ